MRPRKGNNEETMAPAPQGQRRTSVWEHTPGRYSQETEDGAQLWVSAVGHMGNGEDWVTGKYRAHSSQHPNLLERCL